MPWDIVANIRRTRNEASEILQSIQSSQDISKYTDNENAENASGQYSKASFPSIRMKLFHLLPSRLPARLVLRFALVSEFLVLT